MYLCGQEAVNCVSQAKSAMLVVTAHENVASHCQSYSVVETGSNCSYPAIKQRLDLSSNVT